jgi:hypothetical protein
VELPKADMLRRKSLGELEDAEALAVFLRIAGAGKTEG